MALLRSTVVSLSCAMAALQLTKATLAGATAARVRWEQCPERCPPCARIRHAELGRQRAAAGLCRRAVHRSGRGPHTSGTLQLTQAQSATCLSVWRWACAASGRRGGWPCHRVSPAALPSSHTVTVFEQVIDIVLECVCELPVKTSLYATLVALVNRTHGVFVSALLARAHSALRRALKLGSRENNRARVLSRFLATCGTTRAVTHQSALGLLSSMLASALATGTAPNAKADTTWQPRADFMAYCALAALPFAGQELPDGDPEAMKQLLHTAGEYMACRPVRGTPPVMRPLGGDVSGGDGGDAATAPQVVAEHQDDTLEDLWNRLSVCADTGVWSSVHLVRTRVHEPFMRELLAQEGGSVPHELPPLDVPALCPGLSPSTYWEALHQFPLRPRLRVFDAARCESSDTGDQLAPVDRFVGEELVSDTLWAWEDGARFGKVHMAAEQLATGLPWGDKVPMQWVLAEVLFAHATALPSHAYRPVYLAALVKDLCTDPAAAIAGGAFPPAMAAVIKQCFSNGLDTGAGGQLLHPASADALAEVLALHVASTNMSWPWHRWTAVAQLPLYHPRRQWLVALLQRLRCMSYHARMELALPQELRPLLGPAPMPDAGWPYGDETSPVAVGEPDEGPLARTLLALAKEKAAAGAVEAAMKAAMQPVGELPAGRAASVLAHVLAYHGRKTITHLNTMLSRYLAPLALASVAAGGADTAGGAAVVAGVARHGAACNNPQALWVATERLLDMGIVFPGAIVRWVFTPSGHPCGVGYHSPELWRVLNGCLSLVVVKASFLLDNATAALVVESDAIEYAGACMDAANNVMAMFENDMDAPEAIHSRALEKSAIDNEVYARECAQKAQEAAESERIKIEALILDVAQHFADACSAGKHAGDEAGIASYVGLYNAYTAFVARYVGRAGTAAGGIMRAYEATPRPVFPAAAATPMDTAVDA